MNVRGAAVRALAGARRVLWVQRVAARRTFARAFPQSSAPGRKGVPHGVAAALVAAGAGAFAASAWDRAVHAKEQAAAPVLLPAFLAAARECVPRKIKDVDHERVTAALEALAKQKSNEGKEARLSVDEFRLVMNLTSTKDDAMVGIEVCRQAIEVAVFSTHAHHKEKHAHKHVPKIGHQQATNGHEHHEPRLAPPHATNHLPHHHHHHHHDNNNHTAHGRLSDAHVRQFLFNLFDVDGKGLLGRAEVEGALKRLANVAQAHTQGKFLEFVNLSTGSDQSEAEVCSELAGVVLQDLCGASAKESARKAASRADFEQWLQSDTDSSKAVVLLLQTTGIAIAGVATFDAARYGGYAFLLARLAKVVGPAAAGKIRYLAFSSDVGEAFRPVAPVWMVNATYAVAFSYCFFDVAYTGHKESKKEDGNVTRAVVFQTVFQGLASIGLPYLIIHTAVHQSHKLCSKRAPKLAVVVPSLVGLAIIPLLPVVCDEPVEHLLEEAFDYAWPVENGQDRH